MTLSLHGSFFVEETFPMVVDNSPTLCPLPLEPLLSSVHPRHNTPECRCFPHLGLASIFPAVESVGSEFPTSLRDWPALPCIIPHLLQTFPFSTLDECCVLDFPSPPVDSLPVFSYTATMSFTDVFPFWFVLSFRAVIPTLSVSLLLTSRLSTFPRVELIPFTDCSPSF